MSSAQLAAELILALAREQVGVTEKTGKNDGVPAERYNHNEQKPWCAAFVTWCFKMAGYPLPGNEYELASVSYMLDQLTERGAIVTLEEEVRRGDIVFFGDRKGSDTGPGKHVGIVEKVESGLIKTIEGNTSNMVARRKYPLGDSRIIAVARWP